jgi:hypothetical protein
MMLAIPSDCLKPLNLKQLLNFIHSALPFLQPLIHSELAFEDSPKRSESFS